MTYDLIGTIYESDGTTSIDPEGNEYPNMVAVEGYHVNILEPDDASIIEPYVITVNTPSVTFAGRSDTICLKFKHRAEWLALNIEEIEDDTNT